MKIAIDIKSALGDKTGKGVYSYNVIRELVSGLKGHQLIVYTPEVRDPLLNELNKESHVEIVPISAQGLIWHCKVYRDALQRKIDVYFSPSSFIVPALFRWTRNAPATYITVHDLVALLYARTHNKKAVMIEKFTLGMALSSATHVFAVSQNTKKDIMQSFGTPSTKISITPNAVGEHFTGYKSDLEEVQRLNEVYALPKKYILALGTKAPRKNFTLVIEAFTQIQQECPDVDLVIVGGRGWGATNDEVALAVQKNTRIHTLGYVPYVDLPGIYAGASAFIFPSLYEGFGIPPLEAMAVGCPVVTSNVSSLPEVVGDAAIQINPRDVDEAVKALKKLLTEKSVAKKYIEKGYLNITRFSWKKSAQVIIDKILDQG